jgi:hypothetical protein
MKQLNGFLTRAGAWGLALVAASWMFPAQAKEGKAVVRAIRNGYANYSEDGGTTWKRLTIGHRLMRGNIVRTDKTAVVDCFLDVNGPVLRITPDTNLEFTTLTFEQTADETVIDTELGMSNGRILGAVKKLAAASKYEVTTPGGVAAMRGTQFDISYRAGVPLKVSVLDGTVTVRYGTQTFTVNVGYTFDATLNNNQGGVVPTPPDVVAAGGDQQAELDFIVRITTPVGAGVEVVIPVIRAPEQPPIQNPTTETGGGSPPPS